MSDNLDLTPRQEEILALMADQALTSKEVAFQLGVSPKTVDVHVNRFVDRLGARTRAHAILLWDRARRERQQVPPTQAGPAPAVDRTGFVHCPTCGGAGFIRGEA